MESVIRLPEAKIDLPYEALAAFCRRWKIVRLEMFGSVLREDFGPESDVDFIATFAPQADWSLLDHAHMENELIHLLGREVDVLTRPSLEKSHNWIRRDAILSSAKTVYAA